MLEKQIEKDDLLMLQFGVAKELGYTLLELNEKMTYSELLMWSSYFAIINRRQEEELKKAQRRR